MSRVFRHRRCFIEEIESRELLSVNPFAIAGLSPDLTVGLFYEDQYNSVGMYAGQDAGNIFQVAWSGGDTTTALSQLTVQLRDNYFFDPDGRGTGLFHPLAIRSGGNMVASWQIANDGTSITFVFHNGVFTSDKTLRFFVDVDEKLTSPGETPDATVSGTEIGGTTFLAAFTSRDFENTTLRGTLADTFTFTAGLNLPSDRGEIGTDNSHMTAGGQATVTMRARPASLSGFVYEDRNDNGAKEAGEAGITGVTLRLEVWDAVTSQYVNSGRTTTTDATGFYSFTGLEAFARYRVAEVQPSSYASGKNAAGTVGGTVVGVASDANDTISDIDLGANKHGVNYNFGELKPGSLSGTVYEDNNDNGVQDAFEAGIAGVRIALQYRDAGGYWVTERITTTDVNGNYSFANLDPLKIYRLVEDQPNGYASGKNKAGTVDGVTQGVASDADDTISGVAVGYYKSGVHYNFGELKHSSLAGTVFEDDNANGIQDAGETGIAGVTLTIKYLDAGGNWIDLRSTVTGTGGAYLFENLDPRLTYRIVETQPANYYTTQNRAGNAAVNTGTADNINDLITGIKTSVGQNATGYNFGERYHRASLSGTVYEDNNSNGLIDAGELGIVNVTLTLQVLNGVTGNWDFVATTQTDANGAYSFDNLDPRFTYRVVETQPTNYETTHNTAGNASVSRGIASDASDWISGIRLATRESATDYNFGERFHRASIAGTVYEDDNRNGLIDAGEHGIANVTLTLEMLNVTTGNWDFVAGTQTDTNGLYAFGNLDPRLTYRIVETQPTNYDTTHNTAGNASVSRGAASDASDWIMGIKAGIGQNATGYNFGERYHRASLSGTVYEDNNRNGFIDAGELGIVNVTLTLQVLNGVTGNWDFVATTQTNANGAYSFGNLNPRLAYRIVETQPTNYETTHNTAGNASVSRGIASDASDWISSIVAAPLQAATDYNFGERLIRGTLSGSVYEDTNNNGVIDPSETPLADVRVELCRWNEVTGQFESTGQWTFTDAEGHYSFGDLLPGTYCVTRATTPTGYCDGKETLGDHGGIVASDAPRMFNITVLGSEDSRDYNFALLRQGSISGHVFADVNEDGVRDAGDLPLAEVTVTLYVLRDGVYVATSRTTTTDPTGFYKFTDLCPFQTYAVLETQPAGYNDGPDFVGTINGVNVGNNDVNDFLAGITLSNGDAAIDYDFAELIPPPIPPDPPVPPVPTPTPIPPIPWTTPLIPVLPYIPFASHGFAGTSPQLALTTFATTSFGGGGIAPTDVSWHLSVLNGGYPREGRGLSDVASSAARSNSASVEYVSVAWDAAVMDEAVWYVRDKSGRVVRKGTFGVSGGKPIAADFNGDGIDEMAVFRHGEWFIDVNGNGHWDAEDIWCSLGSASDQAVVGDWDGDGKIDIGVFGPQWAGDGEAIPRDPGLPSDLNGLVATQPKNLPVATSELGVRAVKHSRDGDTRLDAIDHVFRYGGAGDVAVTGDWNGDGVTKVGVYRNGTWQLDFNGDGRFDDRDVRVDGERIGGAIPVTGDFDGDGKTNIGIFVDGVWHLDTTGDFAFDTRVEFGQVGDLPVTGDFSGNGISELGVVRARVADTMLTQRNTAPAISSDVAPQIASQFTADDTDATPARQERTQHTPFTNLPLR